MVNRPRLEVSKATALKNRLK